RNRKITLCAADFMKESYASRKKMNTDAPDAAERRAKTSKYNNAWLRKHPEVVQRAREKNKAKRRQATQVRRNQIREAGWLSFTEASVALGVSREMARQYAEQGRLGEIHIEADDPRARYVRVEAVEALRAARASARPAGEAAASDD